MGLPSLNLPASAAEQTRMRRLRVGAILDSLDVPVWVAHVLEQVDVSDRLELALLACNGASVQRSAWENLHGSHLFRAWAWLDYRLFRKRTQEPNAFEIVRFTSKHSAPQVLYCSVQGQAFSESEFQAVRSADIDVLIDFTGTATCDVRDCARYGLWSVGTAAKVLPSLLCLMCEGRSVLEINLQVMRNGIQENLECLRFSTDFLSLFRNYNRHCWGQAQAMMRILSGLQSCGWAYAKEQQLRPGRHSTCPLPGNRATGLLLLRSLARGSRIALERAFLREDWFIAYRRSCPVLEPQTTPTQFVVVRAPRDRFYADPFVVERDGNTFIFFEDYSFVKRKGAISVIEVDAAGKPGEPEPVLEQNYHMSYPCVFEWGGEMYMLPETKGNRTIELYRATDFPRGWRRERVLMTGVSTVDSTIVRHDGKFWLFTCGLNESERLFRGDNELFLLFSDTPFGPWVPHPKNPVVSDVQRCRPAGHLFFEGGHLIRPAQDCSGRYGTGRAVCLNRVDRLSETDYVETPVSTIATNWLRGNIGTHTFNQSSKYQVIDGRTLVNCFVPRLSRRGAEAVHVENPLRLLAHRSPSLSGKQPNSSACRRSG